MIKKLIFVNNRYVVCVLLILIISILPFHSFPQKGLGINITGNPINPKALVDVDATGMSPKAGVLVPRMNTTERNTISAPIPESLLIYNTDTHCFEAYYNGSWVAFGCLSAGCQVPAKPTAGTSIPGTTSIVWNWSDASSPVSYKWGATSDYSSAIDNGTSTSYTQTGLTCRTSYTAYIWAYDLCGNSPVATMTQSTFCEMVFTTPTAGSSFVVPAGIISITVKAWGAGGGGYSNRAGAGGFAQATLAVTPGQTLTIMVGGPGGGDWGCFGLGGPSAGGLNGGGAGGCGGGAVGPTYFGPGGSGGGYSAVKNGGTFLVQAGGGGGSGSCGAGDGGAGGGAVGIAGTSVANALGGGGGTSVAGGAGGGSGATAGSANTGGNGGSSQNGGAGGGGGHFGGGGGGANSMGSAYGGGGGGGSSYATGTGTLLITGAATIPGNITDPDYIGSAGSPDYPGLVVIRW